jgi:hypothetical protein
MSEDRKAAPISLRRRQAPQPSFDRIGEIAAALSSGDSQYPAAARRAVASCDQEPAAESANEGAGAAVPPSEPASHSSIGDKGQARTTIEPPAPQGTPSRRVRVRCEPQELRALRAYAALQGVPLSDLLSDALKPLVEKAVAAMRR